MSDASGSDVPMDNAVVGGGSAHPATAGAHAVVFDSQGRAYVGGDFPGGVGPRLGSGLALTSTSDTPAAGFPDINGRVYAAVSDGAGGTFIGGDFTSVGGVARSRLAHLRPDHTVDPLWNPGANYRVSALALSSDGDSLFVGGFFDGVNAIGGTNRRYLAKLSTTGTGAVDQNWNPTPDNPVLAIAATPTAVYLGGVFSSVDGNPAFLIAKVTATGAGSVAGTWQPGLSGGHINALMVNGDDVYAAGQFTKDFGGGNVRANLVKIAAGGFGAVDPAWAPDPNGEVNALALSGSGLYAGGAFASAGGQSRARLVKLDPSGTGAADAAWTADADGVVNSLAVVGSNLVVGGSFAEIGDGPSPRLNLAQVSLAGSGTIAAWHPDANGPVQALSVSGSDIFAGGSFSSAGPGGRLVGNLFRLNPDGTLDESWHPDVSDGIVNALALDGDSVFVGGQFTKVGGETRLGLAKVSTTGGGAVDPSWNPGTSGEVYALAVSGADLFVGGVFSGANSIGTSSLTGLAKVSTGGTGAVDLTWDPDVGGEVDSLAIAGSDLFVGGYFSHIGGQPRHNLAKLTTASPATADATWGPEPNANVMALVVSGPNLFAGGLWSIIGGTPDHHTRLVKLPTTGVGDPDDTWNADSSNSVVGLALQGDDLYVAGPPETIGGHDRNGLARVSASTGAVDPGFVPGPITSTDFGAVLTVAAAPGRVIAGGTFGNIGALSTSGFALFDLVSPTVSLSVPAEGARLRVGQVVNGAYSCADETHVTCTGNVPAGSPIDTASAGAKTFTVTARDGSGNTDTKSVSYFVDGSAPDVTITVPADGSRIVQGSQLAVTFSCADEDGASDIVSCDGSAPNGSTLSTAVAGPHTFTVTAVDVADNTSTKTASYEVAAPEDLPGVRPVLSAFRIKPAKFRSKARVSYTLSLESSVTFTVKRNGRTVRSFTRASMQGDHAFTFRRGKLRPGTYVMTARAKAPDGLLSNKVSRKFRVLARKKRV